MSSEITTLCLSLYILGFAIGPVLLAPLSEYYGRNPIYIISWFLLVIFQIPLALAPNIGTILVCRFIAGFFGSAPLTNTGGTVSDLWAMNDCGKPMAIYGLSSTFGPPLALVISGYVALEKGWRWGFWVAMIISGGFWVFFVVRHLPLYFDRLQSPDCNSYSSPKRDTRLSSSGRRRACASAFVKKV